MNQAYITNNIHDIPTTSNEGLALGRCKGWHKKNLQHWPSWLGQKYPSIFKVYNIILSIKFVHFKQSCQQNPQSCHSTLLKYFAHISLTMADVPSSRAVCTFQNAWHAATYRAVVLNLECRHPQDVRDSALGVRGRSRKNTFFVLPSSFSVSQLSVFQIVSHIISCSHNSKTKP